MAVNDNLFEFLPTMKHMATIKIIETLLKRLQQKNLLKEAAWGYYCQTAKSLEDYDSSVKDMIEELKMRVGELPVPQTLKDYVKLFLVSMVNRTTLWLSNTCSITPPPLKKQYMEGTIDDLVDNLQWDNVGCIDGRKTLGSYVSSRESIDFVIWNLLCHHCMEDEIIRFSKGIDWNNCKGCINTMIVSYWYHKIFGIAPTKEMYRPNLYDVLGIEVGHEVAIDEKQILRFVGSKIHLFISGSVMTASAIKYFRNYIIGDEEFEKFISHFMLYQSPDEVILYVLRALKRNTKIDTISKFVHNCLNQLPWILFIDDWISVFESIDVESFIHFLAQLEASMCIGIDHYKGVYEPFEKVWRIFYRRFSSDRISTGNVLFVTSFDKDLTFGKIMFKELDNHQRILFIKNLKFHVKYCIPDRFFQGLLTQFSEQVLKNDEERKLFSEIWKL